MDMTIKALVVGATGTVAKPVAHELLARGADVYALVRDSSRATVLPEGVTPVVGDLTDRAAVRAALKGMDSVFFVHPHMDDDVAIIHAFVDACEEAGVRMVFGGYHVDDPEIRATISRQIPMYGGKLEVAARIADPQVDSVILNLPNFAQNDELFFDEIRAGLFPIPIADGGTGRFDLRDSGEIAARAMLDETYLANGWYNLSGPETLNGPQCAAIWSEELGRPVRYLQDGDDWKAIFSERLEGRKLEDWLVAHDMLVGKVPQPVNPDDLAFTTKILGRPPRTYRDFVKDAIKNF
ncbi:NmrA family NAD(P)-binding protein [Actinoplanes sp. NPDC048796]|uniref:SDR family oxidoreductase n=1 Tax=unclassified Actinoplanes TaxID=2626549 RepID=UPI0033E1148E